jgi:hypothetical protein
MTFSVKLMAIGASAAVLAACTSSGTTERNAAYGAAAGAVAGAVIGNNVGDGDAERGAIIGGAVGGAAGAAKGCTEAEDCDMPGVKDQETERDSDGDGVANAYDRYPYDRSRWSRQTKRRKSGLASLEARLFSSIRVTNRVNCEFAGNQVNLWDVAVQTSNRRNAFKAPGMKSLDAIPATSY